jgi:hypothetical protein
MDTSLQLLGRFTIGEKLCQNVHCHQQPKKQIKLLIEVNKKINHQTKNLLKSLLETIAYLDTILKSVTFLQYCASHISTILVNAYTSSEKFFLFNYFHTYI